MYLIVYFHYKTQDVIYIVDFVSCLNHNWLEVSSSSNTNLSNNNKKQNNLK